ncbi:MAG: hypothetical protein RLZ62_2154, partial [Bacteroidota bacterium]
WTIASGFPGNRVEAYLAGMNTTIPVFVFSFIINYFYNKKPQNATNMKPIVQIPIIRDNFAPINLKQPSVSQK